MVVISRIKSEIKTLKGEHSFSVCLTVQRIEQNWLICDIYLLVGVVSSFEVIFFQLFDNTFFCGEQ